MKYTDTVVTTDNIDEIAQYSLTLLNEIEEKTKERQKIAVLITDFIVSTGVDTYITKDECTLRLYPTLSRSLSDLEEDEKDTLLEWAKKEHPDLLMVNHSRLQKLLADGEISPIEMSSSGISLRFIKKRENKKVKRIEDLKIESVGIKEKNEDTYVNPWAVARDENEVKKSKKEIHMERIARLADLQSMWENGETFRVMAKKHSLHPSYIKKLLRPYINQKLREMRKLIYSRPEKSIDVSVEI